MVARPFFLAALALVVPAVAAAQGTVHTPRVHALTGARIVISPGRVLESGTVVIRDGLIESVGRNVTIPADARVWKLDTLTVYAGLIDLAMAVTPAESEKKDEKPAPGLGHSLGVVKSETVIADHLSIPEADREARRREGILTARVLPDQGVFRGQAALVNLGDGDLHRDVLQRECGQVMTFATGGDGIYPESLMGSVAVIRQTLSDSRWHQEAHTRYKAHPAGLERPEWNLALASLEPVARGQEHAIFVTDDVLDILRAGEIAKEFGLRLEFVGSGEEYKRLPEVKAVTTLLVIPVAFPETPAVEDPEEALAVTLEDLRAWDEAPSNPRRVHEAGLRFAFTAHGLTDMTAFRKNVAKAVEQGLPEEVALAALTTVPAEMCGMADRLGTLEAGKIANLVIADGDLLNEKTKVREVWVDGSRYEIEEVKPPEGDPRGTWKLTATDLGGNTHDWTLVIGGELGKLTGTIEGNGRETSATVTQSGRSLVVIFTDEGIVSGATAVRLSLEATGDVIEGSGSVPHARYTVRGKRTQKPETPAEPGGNEP